MFTASILYLLAITTTIKHTIFYLEIVERIVFDWNRGVLVLRQVYDRDALSVSARHEFASTRTIYTRQSSHYILCFYSMDLKVFIFPGNRYYCNIIWRIRYREMSGILIFEWCRFFPLYYFQKRLVERIKILFLR